MPSTKINSRFSAPMNVAERGKIEFCNDRDKQTVFSVDWYSHGRSDQLSVFLFLSLQTRFTQFMALINESGFCLDSIYQNRFAFIN